MPSGRTIIMQALVTMGTMFVLNMVAEAAGGTTRSVIKGEVAFGTRVRRLFSG